MTRGAVLVVSLLALCACATPLKTRYYTLGGGVPPALAGSKVAPDYRVAIGPVALPEALDRLQMVFRVAPNRYVISDAEVWTEPLKRQLPRVLAEDIGRHLPAARVATNSQQGGQDADYRVLIDVLRFESVPGESVTLETTWSIRSHTGQRLHEAHSIFAEPVDAPGVAALIGAHTTALEALSREIATALHSLPRASPGISSAPATLRP